MKRELKTIHLTDNCDMAYYSDDEIFYMIHQGDNEGVTFTVLDFVASYDKEKDTFKYSYKPIIIHNDFNAKVESIYEEIRVCMDSKLNLYLEQMK